MITDIEADTQSRTQELVFRLHRLTHRLSDEARGETFTIYVEQELDFYSRDFIALLGPSGCGKTTLLTILGLLRKPTHLNELGAFELYAKRKIEGDREKIDLKDAWSQGDNLLIEKIRRQHMGFALQSGELVSSLTVTENISVPMQLNAWPEATMRERSSDLLNKFELNRVKSKLSNESSQTTTGTTQSKQNNAIAQSNINRLSGGEYQRVCLARAIAHRPSVVFVDEPTSALNRELANGALTVMQNVQQRAEHPGITLMITHDEQLAESFCNVFVRMAPRKNEPAGEVVDFYRTDTSKTD